MNSCDTANALPSWNSHYCPIAVQFHVNLESAGPVPTKGTCPFEDDKYSIQLKVGEGGKEKKLICSILGLLKHTLQIYNSY